MYRNRIRQYFETADCCQKSLIHLRLPICREGATEGDNEIASHRDDPRSLKQRSPNTLPAHITSTETASSEWPLANGWCNYSI